MNEPKQLQSTREIKRFWPAAIFAPGTRAKTRDSEASSRSSVDSRNKIFPVLLPAIFRLRENFFAREEIDKRKRRRQSA